MLGQRTEAARKAYYTGGASGGIEKFYQRQAKYTQALNRSTAFNDNLFDPVVIKARTKVMVDAVAERIANSPTGLVFAIAGLNHLMIPAAEGKRMNKELREYLKTNHPDQRYVVIAFKEQVQITTENTSTHNEALAQRTDGLGFEELRAFLQHRKLPPEVIKYLGNVPYFR